jgi:hypothetical protein
MPRWGCAGAVLGLCWGCAGAVLMPRWGCAGAIQCCDLLRCVPVLRCRPVSFCTSRQAPQRNTIPVWQRLPAPQHGPTCPGTRVKSRHPRALQVGSGKEALVTLLHEGGHAAHLANVDQRSPFFSQERAPTSVAYAENQSMYLDAYEGDAAWLGRYAKDR